MAVAEKRTKIVSFRVSDKEYEQMAKLGETRGEPSVSVYARSLACRGLLSDKGRGADVETVISVLRAHLSEVFQDIQELTTILRNSSRTPQEVCEASQASQRRVVTQPPLTNGSKRRATTAKRKLTINVLDRPCL
jgi:hypothetical protein